MIQVKVEASHPHRCLADGKGAEGQCSFMSVAGLIQEGRIIATEEYKEIDRCPHHSVIATTKVTNQKRHDYKLTRLQDRIDGLAASDNIKGLRGEIAILRALLEDVINECQNSLQFTANLPKIAELTVRIEKVVKTCHFIEERAGSVLDQAGAERFIQSLMLILTTNIRDQVLLKTIHAEIVSALSSASVKEKASC